MWVSDGRHCFMILPAMRRECRCMQRVPEGQRFISGTTKRQPTSMPIEADKNSAAVTVGRVYYIRQQRSGKYLDNKDGDVTGSNAAVPAFNGSDDQKWKVENAGDGYIKLISQSGEESQKPLMYSIRWMQTKTNISAVSGSGS